MNSKALLGLGGLLVTASSQAITFNFGQVITGPGNATPNPALKVDINQLAANSVRISVTNLAAPTSNQTVKTLWLNLAPYRGAYSFSNIGTYFNGWGTSNNGFNDAGYQFDMELEFKTAGPQRLPGGVTTSIDISATGLVENDFLAMTPNTNGNPSTLMAMAHIISTPNGESVKLGIVPEPGTFAALGLALLPALRRRMKN